MAALSQYPEWECGLVLPTIVLPLHNHHPKAGLNSEFITIVRTSAYLHGHKAPAVHAEPSNLDPPATIYHFVFSLLNQRPHFLMCSLYGTLNTLSKAQT